MTRHINATNTILNLVGDTASEKHFTLANNSVFDRFESSLGLTIPALSSVEIVLVGQMAYQQVQSNIAQINALANFIVLEIDESTEEPSVE